MTKIRKERRDTTKDTKEIKNGEYHEQLYSSKSDTRPHSMQAAKTDS